MRRTKSTFKTMLVLAGAAVALSACAANADYASSQYAYGYPVYEEPPPVYPAYGYFDYWGGGWHRHWDHDHWHGRH